MGGDDAGDGPGAIVQRDGGPGGKAGQRAARAERLAGALRDNLRRRKAGARQVAGAENAAAVDEKPAADPSDATNGRGRTG